MRQKKDRRSMHFIFVRNINRFQINNFTNTEIYNYLLTFCVHKEQKGEGKDLTALGNASQHIRHRCTIQRS